MITTVKSGAVLAAAAAALLLSGAAGAPAFAADAPIGHCVGANSCKGHGSCQSASNACKGENSCKGQSFVEMTKADCAKFKGATFEPAPKG